MDHRVSRYELKRSLINYFSQVDFWVVLAGPISIDYFFKIKGSTPNDVRSVLYCPFLPMLALYTPIILY